MVWSQHGLNVIARDGVLEDVLGLKDSFKSPWLWPQRSSPWPWPRSLKSWKIALSLAEDSTILFERSKIWLKNARNLAENLLELFFCFFGDRLKEIFEELFFVLLLENTCSCILDPWPWAGVPKPGGMGGYISQIFWLYPLQ